MNPGPTEPLADLFGRRGELDLHLPAHGRGRGLSPFLARLLRRRPGSWDLPELPGFGGPLEEEGAVAEAQRRAAALFGAHHCWFGVNGASGLLQAALLGLCPPGARVLLPRNLHRSLLHGCLLGRLQPVLFELPCCGRTGLWQPPGPAHLRRVLEGALADGPLAAVVLVDPTYEGLAADMAGLVAEVRRAEASCGPLPVLVDQAHGRGEAVAAGADLTVLSLQKSAGGLAQSAALLGRRGRIDPASIARALLWLQTSSPSALLLASAAAALEELRSGEGRRRRARAERAAARLRRRLEEREFQLVPNADPLRLVLATRPLGLSGFEADDRLQRRGVIAELPGAATLTFCLGMAPPARLAGRLIEALERLRQEVRARAAGDPLPPLTAPPVPLVATPELPLETAWRARHEALPPQEAAGRIAAEPVCPYPPGIPLLIPGERIDAARAAWLARQGGLWPGALADTVKVVAER